MTIAYINGHFLPLKEARISVLDRGFLFAEGIYEVAAVIDGKLIDSAAHLARLERSAAAIGISLPVPLEEVESVQKELVARNAMTEGMVYLQLTRGADETRDFIASSALQPTLVMFTQAKAFLDTPAVRNGISVISVPDLRWARRDIKSVGLLAQVMAKHIAADAGAQEAWMVEDGFVTEGASSTAFIVTGEGIITRPYSQAVLAGCTATALNELARQNSLTIIRRPFTIAEAQGAQEAFISSASTLCQSVVKIDGQAIGDGKPGPIASQLRSLYIEYARRTAI